MTKPMVRLVNLDTDEVIDKEMTNAEFAEYQAKEQILAEQKAEAEAKATAKAAAEAKLVALGLDLDDLRALGL
jgi:hypothetical protein